MVKIVPQENSRYPFTRKSTLPDIINNLADKIEYLDLDLENPTRAIVLTKWDGTFLPVQTLIPLPATIIYIDDESTVDYEWIEENYKVFSYLARSFYETHERYSKFIATITQKRFTPQLTPTAQWYISSILAIKGFLVKQHDGFKAKISSSPRFHHLLTSIENFDDHYLRAINSIVSVFVINTIEETNFNPIPKSKIGCFIKRNIERCLINASRTTNGHIILTETFKFFRLVEFPMLYFERYKSKDFF